MKTHLASAFISWRKCFPPDLPKPVLTPHLHCHLDTRSPVHGTSLCPSTKHTRLLRQLVILAVFSFVRAGAWQRGLDVGPEWMERTGGRNGLLIL